MQRRLPCAALFVVAALMVAPAALADNNDWKGFFVELDAALATPGNTNTPLIANTHGNFATCSPDCGSDVDWMEWDDDVAYSLAFGYSFGEKGALKISYWTYDDTESQRGSNVAYPRYSWFTIGPASTVGFFYYYYDVDWNFDQEIEASTIDLEYTRTKSISNPLTMTYGVGIRVANFEDTVEGTYADAAGYYTFKASRTVDSDAIGFTGSFGLEYDFNDRFGIGTDLRVGFLNAEVESEHSLTNVSAYGYVISGYYPYYFFPGDVMSESFEADDELATTLDFNFDLIFNAGDVVDIRIGYFYSTWSDMAQFQGSRAGGPGLISSPDIIGEDRERISWSGPRVAVKLKFGR